MWGSVSESSFRTPHSDIQMPYWTWTLGCLIGISSTTYPQIKLIPLQTGFTHGLHQNSILLVISAKDLGIMEDTLSYLILPKCACLLSKYIWNVTTSVAIIMTILISASALAPWSLLSNRWSFKNFWKHKSNHSSTQNTPRTFPLHRRKARNLKTISKPFPASSPTNPFSSYSSTVSSTP